MAFTKDVSTDVTVVAAGSTQTDATQLNASFVVPTAASTDGTKGVKLPVAAPGAMVVIRNIAGSAVNLKVYSAYSTGFINATAGSTAYTIAQNKTVAFFCVGADNWIALLSA